MGGFQFVMDDAHRFSPAAPDEEFVYGACCPGWHSAGTHQTSVEQWISSMQESGIKRVCCLLTGRQLDQQDANIGRYREAFGTTNVLHAPVPDHHLVAESLLNEEILPFLAAGVQRDEPTVVHCLAGIGRTGQVLAAWLVASEGYHPEKAIETVKETGRDPTESVRQGNATTEELLELLGNVPEL